MSYFSKTIQSPVGKLTLVANCKSLIAVLLENEKPGRVNFTEIVETKNNSILTSAEAQIKEYFTGSRTVFDLPIEFQGTEFQKKVWKQLQKIPFGKTLSYSELAKKINSPLSSRAVGAASGKNPLSIICPCHRVIGKSGKLTGFAGGLENKSYLLELEQKS